MNFFNGKFVSSNNSFALNNSLINLNNYQFEKIPSDQTDIVFGIRPEDISVSNTKESREFKIELIEPMGADTLIWLSFEDIPFSVRLEGSSEYKLGDVININFDIKRSSVFGEFYCVPVNIHSSQWMWVNKDVFEKVGVPIPNTIQDFVEVAPKIQEAGYIPLALGGQTWQESLMFGVVASSTLGFPHMAKLYRDKDVDAFRDGKFELTLQTYRDLNKFIDEGAPGRLWNDATAMVVEGKAAVQIMGDWARGEFAVAGKEAKVDYDCVIPGNVKYVGLGGDVFVFPKNSDPKVKDIQLKMASMMVNPTVQADFNNAKGSLPMRLDVDTSAADACMQMGLDLIKQPEAIMRESDDWNSPAFTNAWDDIISEFRNDPNYSVSAAMDDLEDVLTSGL